MVSQEDFDELEARLFANELAVTCLVHSLPLDQQKSMIRRLEKVATEQEVDPTNVVALIPEVLAHRAALRDAILSLANRMREVLVEAGHQV